MLLARSSAAALRTVARPASQTVARRTLHFGHIENKVGNVRLSSLAKTS